MFRLTWFARVSLIGVGLVLSACGCVIDKPLSDPKTSQVDERLLGQWVAVSSSADPDADDSLLIGRHTTTGNPGGLMEGLMVGYNPKRQTISNLASTHVRFFSVSKIGAVDLLNAFYEESAGGADPAPALGAPDLSQSNSYERWAKNPKRGVFLVRYVCDGDQIKFYLVDPGKLVALLDAGEVTKSGDMVSAESLTAYIEKNGADALFVGEKDAAIYRKKK
jgi:hypothetical protein